MTPYLISFPHIILIVSTVLKLPFLPDVNLKVSKGSMLPHGCNLIKCSLILSLSQRSKDDLVTLVNLRSVLMRPSCPK